MTRILLIRHAACDHVGLVLAGRAGGWRLNPAGLAQARALAGQLRGEPIVAVYASPRDRAVQTATPIARAASVQLVLSPAFDEVDYGEWTGLSFVELDQRDDWCHYNRHRATARIPGGETLAEAQARAVAGLHAIAAAHTAATVAVVTHAEIIRCVLAHESGTPLDRAATRFDVEPAGIRCVEC